MKGPPPRVKHKRPERIDLNKQEKHESKRIKSDKACANQNQHETKKKRNGTKKYIEPTNSGRPAPSAGTSAAGYTAASWLLGGG